VKGLKIRDLNLKKILGKGVRMTLFGNISLLKLILQNESQAPQFIVFRGLEIQKKVEGNSNEFLPKSGA